MGFCVFLDIFQSKPYSFLVSIKIITCSNCICCPLKVLYCDFGLILPLLSPYGNNNLQATGAPRQKIVTPMLIQKVKKKHTHHKREHSKFYFFTRHKCIDTFEVSHIMICNSCMFEQKIIDS